MTDNSEYAKCHKCFGAGQHLCPICQGRHVLSRKDAYTVVMCKNCMSGRVQCKTCLGTGKVKSLDISLSTTPPPARSCFLPPPQSHTTKQTPVQTQQVYNNSSSPSYQLNQQDSPRNQEKIIETLQLQVSSLQEQIKSQQEQVNQLMHQNTLLMESNLQLTKLLTNSDSARRSSPITI